MKLSTHRRKRSKGSFTVKKIRGKIYVYKVLNKKGKYTEEYLGPLDEIAKFYLRWCGGRDSNPGRPAPAEPKQGRFEG